MTNGQEDTPWGDKTILYLSCHDAYILVDICLNLLNLIHKKGEFYLM